MTDFAELLSTKVDTIKKPQPWPVGNYRWTIGKHDLGELGENDTPYVEFEFSCSGLGDGVTKKDLDNAGIDTAKKKIKAKFWLTDDAKYRLKDFLELCGVKTGNRTLGQCIPETVGRVVMGYVIQNPSKRPGEDTIFSNIDKFSAAV